MAMGAARLLEKPKTGPHDNMPLELLIRSDQDENGAFNARLELLKNQYADILKIRNKMFAHRDRDTHTEYVNLKWGQGGTGNNATFMERTDLFVLEAAQAISKLMRDWSKEERGVDVAANEPKDVTELLKALDAGQSLVALLRYLPGGFSGALAGQQKDSK